VADWQSRMNFPRAANATDNANSATDQRKESDIVSIVPAPRKKNFGTNISPLKGSFKNGFDDPQFGGRSLLAYRSSLFWWILTLIVVPLVFTSVLICVTVSSQIINAVKCSVDGAGKTSLALEVDTLRSIARLKSTQVQMSINEVVRDLHVLTRFAGWLLFDGITRSDAFTHVEQSSQECRGYNETRICPVLFDPDRGVGRPE